MLNSPPRAPILRALAWQAVAELWRRHGARHSLTVLETHPGISIEGQLRLLLDWRPSNAMGSTGLVFNIGGPAGTCHVHRRGQDVGETVDYVTPLLSKAPSGLVDRLEREMGITSVPELPSSTPSVLVARTLAAALASQCLTTRPLSVTMGWADMSVYPTAPRWTQVFDPSAPALTERVHAGKLRWEDAVERVGHLSALHHDTGSGPLLDADSPFVAFDWHVGMMVLGGERSAERINLMSAYQQAGRTLSPLVARALAHLGC
jgi:hypothetical protein